MGRLDSFREAGETWFLEFELPDDHFLCYKAKTAKGSKFEPVLGIELVDQFEEGLFDAQKLTSVCNPADKNGEGVHDDVTHLVGYQIKLSKTDPKQAKHEKQSEDHTDHNAEPGEQECCSENHANGFDYKR